MEDQEALKPSALVSKLSDAIENKINELLSNGVVATGIVVGSILLSGDQLLRVEELAVRTGTDLI